MRVLITNDDGIDSSGIRALWQALTDIGEVVVIAPDGERSATSQAITVKQPIRVERHPVEDDNITAWRVSGTPTDCVKIALEAIMPEPPDLVVSGINYGSNLGTDVLYSGTVSAAIEGALHGIPAVAVSLDCREFGDFTTAARISRRIAGSVIKNGLPPNTLLNVNVPDLPKSQLGKWAITKLGVRQYINTFEKRTDPDGRTNYWLSGSVANIDNDADSDIVAVSEGYVSITPIHFDLTNYNIMHMLREWNF